MARIRLVTREDFITHRAKLATVLRRALADIEAAEDPNALHAAKHRLAAACKIEAEAFEAVTITAASSDGVS